MNPKTLSCFVIAGSLALAAGRAQTSPVPAGFPDRMERAWPLFKALNANTIEFPLHWEQIEPFGAPRRTLLRSL